MAVRNLSDVVNIGLDVLKTTLSAATGFISAQLGNVVSSTATSDDAEWYFPPGIVGRVRKPDAGKGAAQVVTITRSDHDAIVGCRDARVKDIYGQLDDGETAVFASVVGGAVAIFKKDGSLVVTSGDGSTPLTVSNGTISAGAGAQAMATKDDIDRLISALNTFAAGTCVNGAVLTTSAAFITAISTGSAKPIYSTVFKAK